MTQTSKLPLPSVEDTILFAVQAHRGGTAKGGAPYILHVLRVALMLESAEEQIVGLLHDTIEETSVTLDQLRVRGYSDAIVNAVDHLTWRKECERYEDYIERLRSDPLAVSVKLADIKDHLTPATDRGPVWLQQNHPKLYERYQKAMVVLSG